MIPWSDGTFVQQEQYQWISVIELNNKLGVVVKSTLRLKFIVK